MTINRITIGKGKKENPNKIQVPKQTELYKPEINTDNYRTLDQNIWGNDSEENKKLDKEVLAEKRMYVRIRYIQHIECNMLSDSLDTEPVVLAKPMSFNIFDLSMGGIGIICDQEIKKGLILSFKIRLDQIEYDVMCESIYCIEADSNYKIGLKIIRNNRDFIKHLKILVARTSLSADYLK